MNNIVLQKIKRFMTLFGFSPIKDIKIIKNGNVFDIIKDNKIIKISAKHKIYMLDIIDNFEYYFSSVKAIQKGEYLVIDFSCPRLHEVNGYDLHKIIMPSIPEPIETTTQYIDFAKLDESSIVIDLGAYSGLTSILFDREISKNNPEAPGRVISVEADVINLSCLIQNIQLYKETTKRNVEFLFAAVSNKNGYEYFLADGAMGANSNLNNKFRNSQKIKVPAITLSSIAERFNLEKIDFIKCDIEGAEEYIFEDEKFFEKYSPKIIIETHIVNTASTQKTTEECLSKYGYTFKAIDQYGSDSPLIECTKQI